MSARMKSDGSMVYTDEFGSQIVGFQSAFADMDRETIEATRKRLLDQIAAEERKLVDLRAVHEKASKASKAASERSYAAYRSVEASETRLSVINIALMDSLKVTTPTEGATS